MKEIGYLVKRNSLLFLRERSAVFFSLLSMLIVLALMVIFLGRMNSQALVDLLSEWGGERDRAADERNAAYLIQLWTLAGILVVNAVTVTLTVTGSMVQDETEKRLAAFYVTPMSRLKLSLGYILSAWLVGTGMCLLTLAAGEGYFALRGYGLLGAAGAGERACAWGHDRPEHLRLRHNCVPVRAVRPQQQRLERPADDRRHAGGLRGRDLSAHGFSVRPGTVSPEVPARAPRSVHDAGGLHGGGHRGNLCGNAPGGGGYLPGGHGNQRHGRGA